MAVPRGHGRRVAASKRQQRRERPDDDGARRGPVDGVDDEERLIRADRKDILDLESASEVDLGSRRRPVATGQSLVTGQLLAEAFRRQQRDGIVTPIALPAGDHDDATPRQGPHPAECRTSGGEPPTAIASTPALARARPPDATGP